ncbi:MAG: hypothetical protein RO257_13095 [Candidatus Kapabacteria bacterium]|nr:hypothetical protein [Candidatus Kapabacteria bacterium]
MQSYSYDTQIDKSGFLTIPVPKEFVGNLVKVVITPLIKGESKMTGLEFIEKWAGLLKDDVISETRIDYLESKHK